MLCNGSSIKNKTMTLHDVVKQGSFDLPCITKAWLETDNVLPLTQLALLDYCSFINRKWGGGVRKVGM